MGALAGAVLQSLELVGFLTDVGHQPLGMLGGKIISISQKLVLFSLGEGHSWALGSGALLGLCPSPGGTWLMKAMAVTCSSNLPEDGSEEKWGWMAAAKSSLCCPRGGRALGMGQQLVLAPHEPSDGELGMEGSAAVSRDILSCLLPNLCQLWISMRKCHFTSAAGLLWGRFAGQGFIASVRIIGVWGSSRDLCPVEGWKRWVKHKAAVSAVGILGFVLAP